MSALHYICQQMPRLSPGEEAVAAIKGRLTRLLARTLLIAYGLLLLKPIMPVLTDMLAHAFWENVHIAVVHKVNGKEHVHYELRRQAAAESKQDKAGQKHKVSEEDSYALPVISAAGNPAYCLLHVMKPIDHYLRTHDDAEQATEAPPPKQA